MKLNKKYFLAILTTLGIQMVLGVSSAKAVPCESEILDTYTNEIYDGYRQNPYDYYGDRSKFNQEKYDMRTVSKSDYIRLIAETAKATGDYGPPPDNPYKDNDFIHYSGNSCVERHSIIARLTRHAPDKDGKIYPIAGFKGDKLLECVSKYLSQNNCDISAFLSGSSTKNNKSLSSSGSTSSQSSSAQSNSPESYNIKVSQINKQNYQALQRAYEQANAGKGKKHNKEANATECMKTNPAHKSFTNKCNQPINFAYCFSGVPTGAKNENPQTLADLSCQNGQFGTLTIGAGESIPGTYNGLFIGGLPCKSPSQPVDMAFDRATNTTTGRCSF